jgi:hypothetical protein
LGRKRLRQKKQNVVFGFGEKNGEKMEKKWIVSFLETPRPMIMECGGNHEVKTRKKSEV